MHKCITYCVKLHVQLFKNGNLFYLSTNSVNRLKYSNECANHLIKTNNLIPICVFIKISAFMGYIVYEASVYKTSTNFIRKYNQKLDVFC